MSSTIKANLNTTSYVQVNSGQNPIMLQAKRDSVRLVMMDAQPAASTSVFHSLGGDSAPLNLNFNDTNIWALATSGKASLYVTEVLEARSPLSNSAVVSVVNSTDTPLVAAATFTGEWEDALAYESLVVAVKTDQIGTFEIQFSPDGVNQDSTLTRYYRAGLIEVPHRFTVTRRYIRIAFTNISTVDQTFLRLQTILGARPELNAPNDSRMAQDFDAVAVRPSSYNMEVALGKREGAELWNKFGYNNNISIGTEVVASFGGPFVPLTTATTLTVVSTSAADDGDPAGTGCNSIVIYGVDENRDAVIQVVTLNGIVPVITTSTWLGINRVAIFLCGSGQKNAGSVNITATTGGLSMAQMPAGGGVSQQCIFHIPRNHSYITELLRINTLRQGGGVNPQVTVKMWVYSITNNAYQEVYKVDIDTGVTNDVTENPNLSFPIDGNSVVWLEATTDKADTIVNARFSGTLIRDVDA